MFKIYDGREHFYQWDLDRKLIVGDRTIQAVHFCNRTGACAITRDCYDVNGMWLVDVPNLCLQESYRLKVYGFSAAKYTTVSAQFDVKSRTKPDGYVYTDDEVNCWQDLDQRVAALEENPVSDEAITAGIDKYLAANPIEKGATDAEKEQIARNAEDIAALKAQADTYATEEYVDAAVANAGGNGVGMVGGGEGSVILNDYDNNDASGRHSVAEGSATIAEGKSSHAEGGGTTASGNFSHAEGRGTNAFGPISHAEGYLTQASGEASHAEGAGTIASGNYQHAQGRSNIEDTENKYALIVGNGDEPDNSGDYGRSNAHTLDWDGNAWFAGNVRVGGTCWDDATELGAGGGESEIEFVNATGDETIELDKTYDEIMAMIEAGKIVVIKYNDYIFYQYSDSPAFRYVGEAETRYIGFNKRDGSVRYSEAILPTYEDVGTIVEEAVADFQTAEQVNAAIANYVGVIENAAY